MMNEENGFVLVDDVVKDLNFSRTHMNLLVDRGEINTAMIDGSLYMTYNEFLRFKKMRDDGKAELLKKFAEQDDIRDKAVAEIAGLFKDKE